MVTAALASSPTVRAARPRRGQIPGGVAAQFSQAGASFVLQLLAVRLLGVDGLGQFAAVYGLVVLGAALNSGFVGDSLTVLPREQDRIRAGLQLWWLALPALFGTVLAIGVGLAGMVNGWLLIFVGLAAAAFLAEDILRRLLMATLSFWRIVVVDMVGLLTTLSTLLLLMAQNTLEMGHLFVALAVGQSVALLAAIALLPVHERVWLPCQGADLLTVAAYGSWRALHHSVRPALLAGVRVGGLALASAAAVGELEAARIYLSPALIVIGGLSSVMLARFAAGRAAPVSAQIRSADRAAAWILAASLLCLAMAFAAEPAVAPLLTGGRFELPALALVGWALFAAANGFSAPYATLAAVRSGQRAVVAVKIVEAMISALAFLFILHFTQEVNWAPIVLSFGAVASGLALRVILVRQARRSS